MTTPADRVRHLAFNPLVTGTLQRICTFQQTEGWALVRVVPHHQFESVAVFEPVHDQGSANGYL